MPWTDVFAPAEAENRRIVMANTWGHLAPKKNVTYNVRLVFAIGCFGSDHLNPTVIHADFTHKVEELDSSPWLFDSVQDFLGQDDNRGEPGNVYEFVGTWRNYRFIGQIRRVYAAEEKSNGKRSTAN